MKHPTRRAAARPSRLTAEHWTIAALEAIAEGGVANVSVEGLARGLGASKGSFYWHFKDRAALIHTALEEWERRYTDQIIASLDEITDPRERFRKLLDIGFEDSLGARIDANLVAESGDANVRASWERVATKRLAYVRQILHEAGVAGGPDRAVLAFSAYVGMAQLRRMHPTCLPSGRDRSRYIENAVNQLLGAP